MPGTQVPREAGHLAVAGALQHELDAHPSRRGGVQRSNQGERDGGTGGVVGRGGSKVGGGQLQQQRQVKHQDDRRDELQDGHRGAGRAAAQIADDRHGEQPEMCDHQPAEPSRREPPVTGEAAQAGRRPPQRDAVDEPRSSGVVVGGDDQADRPLGRTGASIGRQRLADDVLAGVLGCQSPPQRATGEPVGADRDQRNEHQRAAQPGVGDHHQAAGDRQQRVPAVGERPVGTAPERFDARLTVPGDGLRAQPQGGQSLGVGAGAATRELGQLSSGLGGGHRA